MSLSEEHKKYLANKHRGGISNQKGNLYEDIYATKEIVRLIATDYNLDTTFVTDQIENAFVDDFLIIYPDGRKVYHQCKDCTTLSWTKDKKGELLYDFKWQKHYSQSAGEDFKLKIVYSSDTSHIHLHGIPVFLHDVVEKELFISYPSLNALLLDSDEFQKNIQTILFEGMDGYTYDKMGAFAEIVRSQWQELSSPNIPVSLGKIKKDILSKYPEVNFKSLPNVNLPKDLEEIFKRFTEFDYVINGRQLQWRYRKMSGNFIVSPDVCDKIISENPSDIYALISLFN